MLQIVRREARLAGVVIAERDDSSPVGSTNGAIRAVGAVPLLPVTATPFLARDKGIQVESHIGLHWVAVVFPARAEFIKGLDEGRRGLCDCD